MKRAPIAPFLLLLLLVPADARLAAQQPKAQSFEQLFTRAVELQQAGDLLGAIDTYKAALTIVPGQRRRAVEPRRRLRSAGAVCRSDRAIRGGAQDRAAQPRRPAQPGARLLQIGAAERCDSPVAARARGQPRVRERVSHSGGLLPADRSGPGSRHAAAAPRADVRRGPRLRLPARYRAAHMPATHATDRNTSIASSAPATRPRRAC